MSGYVRRFTYVPTLETIQEIEGLVIIDLAPPAPVTGAGTGTVLLVGEFEDGYFATQDESQGAVEVYGSSDYAYKFGLFGYTYSGVKANNPSARKALGQCWNGNGFIKSYKLKCSRLLISRVDMSVGEVTFSPHVTIKGGTGPWALSVGGIVSVTTNTGTGSTAAIAATRATVTGASQAFSTIIGGDSVWITVDQSQPIKVTFAATDTTQSAVIARINSTLGATVATTSTAEIALTGLQYGTGGKIVLANVTGSTVLTKLGLTAGTTNGTGNVANLAAVTAAEVAALVTGSSTLQGSFVSGRVGPDGKLWIFATASATTVTLEINAGTGGMAAALGLPVTVNTPQSLATMPGGTIPAGTRVRTASAGQEWVTMQSLDVPAGTAAPITVKVRPGNDDGTHVGAISGLVTTLYDVPTFIDFAVTNSGALSAALTEAQRDARYTDALNATLNELGPSREANYLLVARRSDAVARAAKSNALTATEIGFFGRKYVLPDILGVTPDHSIADVVNYRSDRVFYTTLGLKVTIPQIAERGLAGGTGFSADGVITVPADGPLTTLCAMLPPEENPGQQTGLIDDFFAVNAYGSNITVDAYKAFRKNGICAPRVDRTSGTIFQSGVTSSLLNGQQTIARRRMADFIQDSAIGLFLPYSKRLARESTRNKLLALWNQFLAGLESAKAPERSRIHSWSTDDGPNAGNTPATLALGIYYILTTVKTHPSLNDIVLQTEIGENAIITKTV